MDKEWQWRDATSEGLVVIQSVQAVAVYTNQSGDIVIRQQSAMQEEDSFIVIPRSSAKALSKAIAEEAKKHFVPE